MKLTALSSGPLTRASLDALFSPSWAEGAPDDYVICITSSAQDLGLGGVRLCPDLDAAVAAFATADGETAPRLGSWRVRDDLASWGMAPVGDWPHLTDDAFAAGIARNIALGIGLSPSQAAARQLAASGADTEHVTVLPVTEIPVELHVVEASGEEQRGRHVQRWLADPDRGEPLGFAVAGLEGAAPAPNVLEAMRTSDVVVLTPMSPVLDAAGLLGVSGVRDALRGTSARVVTLSPVGLPTTRDGAAESAAWQQAGLGGTSADVARLYADFTDVLVIDVDEAPNRYPTSVEVVRAPLAAALAGDAQAREQLRAVVLTSGS